MQHTIPCRRILVVLAVLSVASLTWPAAGAAQTLTGLASAVRATVLGQTTVLASTGTLTSSSDAREASASSGNVSGLLTGETLHASTIGWPDQVASEASLAGLSLGVGTTRIGADFVMARALALLGSGGAGTSNIDNLSINGSPVAVSGAPNQTIPILGGLLVINEQQTSAAGTVVNALHVVVPGVADVVVGSATAAIQ